jgi:uncharacterized cupin superfamily protein
MRSFNLLAEAPGEASLDVGEAVGAAQIGARLYRLDAGAQSAPLTSDPTVESWLLVLGGAPVLGEQTLRPGDLLRVSAAGAQLDGPGTALLLSADRTPGRPEVDAPAVNLYDVAVGGTPDLPRGYRHRMARVGPGIGGVRLGATVYELDPGNSICPYHYENVEEEWLVVLRGTPTLRDPEGERRLAAGVAACFPVGPEGAHKLTNQSHSLARVLMLSTIPEVDLSICVYPDSGKVSVYPPGKIFRLRDAVDYWDGEA